MPGAERENPPTANVRWPFGRWCAAALAHRYMPLGVASLAMLLASTSLSVGLVVDDYFHRAALQGSPAFDQFIDSPLALFSFFDGDPERVRRMMALGFLPWWTYPEIKAAFFRPITVLTHWIDYRLWPETPALMHVHSLLWFGAAVFVVALLYRRFMGAGWVAGLAALLFAVDDAHAMPVGFLANRNVLIAVVFGALTLLLHDRWRRDGARFAAFLAPLMLALSLLAKESGLATCGYLLAHAVFLDRGHLRRRIVVLMPYVCVTLVWAVAWKALDYGVANVGLYVDPLNEPLRYLAAVVERVPVLLMGQWATPPAEVLLLLERAWVPLFWCGAMLFLLVLAVLLIPLLRTGRVVCFWLLGMVLATLPACATAPADRLLFFVGIGAMGVLARLLQITLQERREMYTRQSVRGGACVLGGIFVVLHLVVAPMALPARAAYPVGPGVFEQFTLRLPQDAELSGRELVVVNPPSVLHSAYFLVQREHDGKSVPRCVWQLAPGMQPIEVARRDDRTLVIRPRDGYLAWVFERLFRDERFAFSVGEQVDLDGLTVTIEELLSDGRPAVVSFGFDVPLESAALHWVHWHNGQFMPFTPPAVGGVMHLEGATLSMW